MKNNKIIMVSIIIFLLPYGYLFGASKKDTNNDIHTSAKKTDIAIDDIDFNYKIPINLARDIVVQDMVMYALNQASHSGDYNEGFTGQYLRSLGYDNYSDFIYSHNSHSKALEGLISTLRNNDLNYQLELQRYNDGIAQRITKSAENAIKNWENEAQYLKSKCKKDKKCIDKLKNDFPKKMMNNIGFDKAIQGYNYGVESRIREIQVNVYINTMKRR